ncbi:MAG: hypothetical protein HY201_01855 [Nitrospirae bacterium]|nr:hypothetical protein [Candidatus Troglogloeales bacterium]MBI3598187.1 hypothetical protein [Candidatus Troglogloeales bacterium]
MKLGLNLSKLLEEKKITLSEFERYVVLSREDTSNNNSDYLVGHSFMLISYGFMGLYLGSHSGIRTSALFMGLANIGLGFFLKSNRILLTTICFVFGGLLILLWMLELILGPWQP